MIRSHLLILLCSLATLHQANAHSWKAGETPVFDEALRAHILAEWEQKHGSSTNGSVEIKPVSVAALSSVLREAAAVVGDAKNAPDQARPFQAFPKLQIKWDKDYLFIGSNGMPDHPMMAGITSWQQQVPLPQSYFGDNAWRVPRHPVPAKKPVSIKGNFLRGAIALAANGIPIFNPQNNRGEVSQEIGELDQWGGHCGRADDYHYHAAPLHLQAVVGKGMPIAYALDGYPIYGLTEPDGMPTGKLDDFNGHETEKLGYHYHASTRYPYINGGFHGEVVEAGGQVDPQPRAQPVRPDTAPLRGAEITAFESTGGDSYKLTYTVNGSKRSVAYSIKADGTYPFEFDNGSDGKTREVYAARQGNGGGGGNGRERARRGSQENETAIPSPAEEKPLLLNASKPPMDLNGDGTVTAVEFAEATKREHAAKRDGSSLADTMTQARAAFTALDRNGDGKLDGSELPSDAKVSSPPKALASESKGFVLTSPEVEDGGNLPIDYTGDGSGATLPLAWKGAPAGTKSYALIMDHLAPGNEMKSYWVLWDIPASVTSLTKNVKGVGKLGVGFRGEPGYEPPHSKGPGAKTYVLHLYALSAEPNLKSASGVNREMLLAAMQGSILATADLHVVYTRGNSTDQPQGQETGARRPPSGAMPNESPGNPPEEAPGQGGQRKPWIQMHATELDADHDGVITLQEIRTDMQKAVAKYDADRDNVITPSEIEVAGDIREGAAFAGLIYRHAIDLDMNHDSRLTNDEFAATAKYILGSADRDSDGKVSAAEVESAPNAPLPMPATGADTGTQPPALTPESSSPEGRPAKGRGPGKGGNQSGLIKPGLSDTLKLNVYADNWFMLYVNGRLVAVDPIPFTPHNVVSVDFLPEYPMTIAVLAKDNADPKTGLEYGSSIGDGGFILKFSDGTGTHAKWKAKNFFHGPLDGNTQNPQVKQTDLPVNWWAVEFDDSQWAHAKEYSVEEVDPKEPYFENDFDGAKFIWTDSLALDNTVIFRTRIEKPGWKPRWTTKPDLDVTGAPQR